MPFQFLLERVIIITCLGSDSKPTTPVKKRKGKLATTKAKRRNSLFARLYSSKTDKATDETAGAHNVIRFDDEYGKTSKVSEKFDIDSWSLSTKVATQVNKIAQKLNPLTLSQQAIKAIRSFFYRTFMKLSCTAYIIVQTNLFIHRMTMKKSDEVMCDLFGIAFIMLTLITSIGACDA
jgi:hypothetical protein